MPSFMANFFMVSVEASATLLGLLFVTLSVDAGFEKGAQHRKHFLLSRSAFIGLAGIFLLSFLEILQSASLVVLVATIVLSAAGISDMLLVRRNHAETTRESWFIGLTVVIYILLTVGSITVHLHRSDPHAWVGFGSTMLILYGLALLSAWRSLILATIG